MEMGSSCGDLGLVDESRCGFSVGPHCVLPVEPSREGDLGNSFGEVGLKGDSGFGVFNDIRYHEVCESSELWCSETVLPLVNSDVDNMVQSDGICPFSRECNVASLDFENDVDFSNGERHGTGGASENVVLSGSEQMEQRELGIVIGLHAKASVSEVLSDRSFGPSEEIVTGSHRLEEDGSCALATTRTLTTLCNLTGGSSGIASCCALESESGGRDGVSDAPTCCSSVVEFSGLGSNGGGDGVNLECVSVSDVADLISLRRRSNRLARTRSCTRKFQQTSERISFLSGSVGIFSNKSRRKRSCFCKPARSSVWGALGNLTQVFVQNNGGILGCDSQLVHIQNQGLKKARRGAGKGKQKKTCKGGNSLGYKAKGHRAPATRIRLKVKMEGDRVQVSMNVLPEAVDSPSPAQIVNTCVPISDSQASLETLKIASEAEGKSGAGECGVGECLFLDRNLEKLVVSSDISVRDAHHGDKDLESTVTQDTSVENTLGDCPGVCSRLGIGVLGDTVDNRCSDPGTSPDSGVLHPVPDVCIITSHVAISTRRKATSDGRISGNLHDASSVRTTNTQRTGTKKGKKNRKVKGNPCIISGQFSMEENSFGRTKNTSARKLAKRRSAQKVSGSGLTTNKNASSQASSCEEFITEPPTAETMELQLCQENLKSATATESLALSGQDVGSKQSESRALECSLSTVKTNGCKPSETSKSGVSKCRSHLPKSARIGRGNARGKKNEGMRNSVYKEEGKSNGCLETGGCISSYLEPGEDSSSSLSSKLSRVNIIGDDISRNLGKIDTGKTFASEDISSSAVVSTCNTGLALENPSHSLQMQPLPQLKAWVSCDDCHKWRCISAELADKIEETKCKWTCMDNTDKAFAECLIPQEKSNAEINAELEISDASGEEDTCRAQVNSKKSESRPTEASQQASWTLIRNNLFLHRSRKSQTIDEIMVCHCRPPLDGSLGCGDECLNRMLNIECVRGTCPCGDRCSNQQFQKRKYAKFKWMRCGKKGYGLQLQQGVSQGAFLIEYVGEVLDMHAYEARQRDYASRGQKHFYFMTLNGSEVIDACAKGNLGRFINHSCDPNCRTEKWMVNGEVCIGLFAIRDIKKGEEVTFDYNYVRVFGAAAKKCVCGSSECRGYIGGDPSNTEVVVQGDSDDDYPEPFMVNENGKNGHRTAEIIQNMSLLDVAAVPHAESPLQTSDTMSNSLPAVQKVEISLQVDDTMNKSLAQLAAVQTVNIFLPIANSMSKSVPDSVEDTSKPINNTVKAGPISVEDNSKSIADMIDKPNSVEDNSKSIPEDAETNTNVVEDNQNSIHESVENKSNTVENNSKSVSDTVINKHSISKSRSLKKSSSSSGSIKKGRFRASQVITNKSKKLVEETGSGRFEGVEEKLNELLDADGGISKRKDATKGYLKLLLVTAASGDNVNGEAFHSTRDLSMVLDALLKTKSRMVLVDIINKNGLQMLHNIMKQNRRNFKKIPIIRKLLKVLEFLALKEIVTLEHINTAPPCTGMESFKESIIALTRHNDIQVHQIARNFRDKWIPRTIRKVQSDRDDVRFESQSGYYNRFSVSHRRWRDQDVRHHTDAIHCISQEIPMQERTQEEISLQMSLDADNTPGETSKGSFAPSTTDSNPTEGTKKRKRKSRWDQPAETNPDPQPPPAAREQIMEVNLNVEMLSKLPQTEVSQAASNHVTEAKSEEKNFNSEADVTGVSTQHVNEEAPPGFPSPLSNPQVPSASSMEDATPPGFPSPLTNSQAPPSGSSVDAAAPPGFSPPLNNPQASSSSSMDAATPPGFPPSRNSPQAPPGSSMDAATPPGFPPSLTSPLAPAGSSVVDSTIVNLPQKIAHTINSCEVVMGNPARFLAHLPVSYGIPLALVLQLGTPRGEVGDDWVVAPGIPFHPFPPLPPYPRGETNPPLPSQPLNNNHRIGNVREEEAQLADQYAITHQADAIRSSVSGAMPPDVAPETGATIAQGDSVRWPSDGLGRRFFRQQKWKDRNFRRCGPPLLRQRNGWGFNNSNKLKGGVCIGNIANEGGGCLRFPENVSSIDSGENASSTYYNQQPPHQYHH